MLSSVKLHGFFEHIYKDNYFGIDEYGTHYIIAALNLTFKNDIDILDIQIDSQHKEMKFMSSKALLEDDHVHEFTKSYFLDNPLNRFL